MKARAATLFPVLLMGVLAGLTLWLDRIVQLSEAPARRAPTHDPDFIVDRFTVTRMSPEGRPVSKLTAEKMLHYPDDETTELIEPRFEQRSADAPPLHVRADRGGVSKDGERVELRGDVVVVREPSRDREALRVDTTYLEIFPKEEIARTQEPVTIKQGAARLDGVGMEVLNKSREFSLNAKVRGNFPAATAKPK